MIKLPKLRTENCGLIDENKETGKQLKIGWGQHWNLRYEIWQNCNTRYPCLRMHSSNGRLIAEDWDRIKNEKPKQREHCFGKSMIDDELPF